jgi:hypothetical protein
MQPLDYRSTFDTRAQQALVRAMQLSTGLSWGKVAFGLVFGLLATVIFSGFVAAVVSIVVVRIWPGGPHGIIYLGVFLGLSTWAIAVAWRRQANPIEDELGGYGGRSSSYGEYEMRAMTATIWVYIELLLWGPRTLVWAVGIWKNQGRLPDVPLERAADVLLALSKAEGGVDVEELIASGDSGKGMGRVLAYLKARDWIDSGSKGRRVWLTSRARKKVGEAILAARGAKAREQ